MSTSLLIFVSYSHRDARLKTQVLEYLAPLSLDNPVVIWDDRKIGPGINWANEIDDKINTAQIILLLISINFINSGYAYGIELRRALERDELGEARVIPIILRSSPWNGLSIGKLNPLPIGGRPLDSFRNRAAILTDITEAVRAVLLEMIHKPPPQSPASRAKPVSDAGIRETGAMPLESEYYIQRRADEVASRCLESITPTLVVKGCGQSGKSSLLVRLHFDAINRGHRSCYLNLDELDEPTLSSPKKLLRALARMIADSLETETAPDEFWDVRRDLKENLTSFVEENVLGTDPAQKVLLVFDKVDVVSKHEKSRNALFTMLRAWHDRRAYDASERWKRFRLVIAHSTDPSRWIINRTQSPFNVGTQVTLDDFDQSHIEDLNRRYRAPLKTPNDIQGLIALVGGHPFLTRLSFDELVTRSPSLAKLKSSSLAPDGPFAEYLSKSSLAKAEFWPALRTVMENNKCADETLFQRFWAEGLVRGPSRTDVRMRCGLFEQYLRDRP